jgi:hypothetical protein
MSSNILQQILAEPPLRCYKCFHIGQILILLNLSLRFIDTHQQGNIFMKEMVTKQALRDICLIIAGVRVESHPRQH